MAQTRWAGGHRPPSPPARCWTGYGGGTYERGGTAAVVSTVATMGAAAAGRGDISGVGVTHQRRQPQHPPCAPRPHVPTPDTVSGGVTRRCSGGWAPPLRTWLLWQRPARREHLPRRRANGCVTAKAAAAAVAPPRGRGLRSFRRAAITAGVRPPLYGLTLILAAAAAAAAAVDEGRGTHALWHSDRYTNSHCQGPQWPSPHHRPTPNSPNPPPCPTPSPPTPLPPSSATTRALHLRFVLRNTLTGKFPCKIQGQ